MRRVRLPWAEPHARFTLLFEGFAIDVLLHTSIQAARRILRVSWDEAYHLMERAVTRGLRRKGCKTIPVIGVDEKSVGKGQRNYVTVVSDLGRGTVEEVIVGRSSRSLETYFQQLTPQQRDTIEAVSMDMSSAYISAVEKTWPEDGRDKIVFDRFHVMKQLGDAVDKVRRQEHKALLRAGSSLLTGTRYIWLYARENLPEKYWNRFFRLKDADLKTARAWALKENIRKLWDYKCSHWAWHHWKRWFFWATHSRLEPVRKAAYTLKNHLYGIMNYFKHRITNGAAEGINSRIATLLKTACGFRNKARLRIAILFHFGGLEMYPVTH
ncbi:ISL3 family transposase [Desulfolithobacter dissulfuricans]|uniref:ISL3 family transposase n=1 Tax=Desulfolithobacter dissulfuricans TaxID=2795293 RepID=A0A915U5N2_9BACT|nr:ISL3 family transposase [Desulfolithobacter dissulfuricans]